MDLVTYALSKKGIIRIDEKEYKPELENGNIVYKEIEKPVEYTTFTLEDSLMKFEDSGEMGIIIVNTYENSIEELYVNNTHVKYLPPSKLGDEQDFDPTEDMFPVDMSCIVKAKKGDQIKIKGSFSLYINAFAANDVNAVSISNVVLQNDLEDCSYMFTGINLTEAPKMPQNAKNCTMMFAMCTSLTKAQVIPEGVTNCMGMFAMTGITEAPVIPSSVTDCSGMFSGCIGLTTLPSENVDLMYNHNDGLEHSSCYSDCVNIVNPITIDDIPTEWGGNKVEEPIGPTGPTGETGPTGPTGETGGSGEEEEPGLYTTFTVGESGTLNLANISSGSIKELYIDDVAQDLPTGIGYNGTSAYTVENGQKIKIKGSFRLNGTTLLIKDIVLQNDLEDCNYMFDGCTGLTQAPAIPSSVTNCSFMFNGCTGLTQAPVIPNSVTDCSFMFYGCTSLTTLPSENVDLMYTRGDELQHEGCYRGCTKIVKPITYDDILVDWK